jgi:HEAT repeat protein
VSTEVILVVAAAANVILIVGLSLGTALFKARRQRRAARHDREIAQLRPVVMRYLATWEDGDTRDLADTLIGYKGITTSFEELAAGLLPKLRGADRSVLVDILRRRGTIDFARSRTHSRMAVRRYRAVELLGSAGTSEGIEDSARLLSDHNTEVRLAAVRALGRIGGIDSAAALLKHLDRPNAKIPPHPVTMSLLRIGVDATGPLRAALTAEQVHVRTIAAEVLGVLGVYPATNHLQDRLSTDAHRSVRLGAAHAVGRLAMPSSVAPLIRTIETDTDVEVLAAACTALGRIADPESITALEKAVRHAEPTVRVAAAMALVPMGEPGLERLRAMAQQEAVGGDAAREVLARTAIATDRKPLIAL